MSGLATTFAEPFGAAQLARLVGLWHDVGKFDPAFQAYLLDCEMHPKGHGRSPDHKAAGSLIAARYAAPIALLVQGHHGGLRSKADLQTWLVERKKDPVVAEAMRVASAAVPGLIPAAVVTPPRHLSDPLSAELFIRMLFSALVDADFLDTERHFNIGVAATRGSTVAIDMLWDRFQRYHGSLPAGTGGVVNETRTSIYDACIASAELPPGLFRLTVPTGGGKTLSGMAFALRHAQCHGLRRVVVAVPFISITEQTAAIYRSIFEPKDDESGAPTVLEHHSAAFEQPRRGEDDEDFRDTEVWRRLAAENWDAPIVVTTTVQLFESLFAASTSRCRKLHRLARSVIILDEAQALPATLLEPILDALSQLCIHFGTTVVLSTATQPAFDTIPAFVKIRAREIVPEPARFFTALRRVRYEWLTERPMEWAEVAGLMRSAPAALAVVNTKKDAIALLDALADPEAFHLSTLLCGAHRRQVIEAVKQRLRDGLPCRLVATQVIEAGVDLDFPLVLRALGPLDNIIQAAGRCNREGRLPHGRVVIFRPVDETLPKGAYVAGTNITQTLLATGHIDPDDPSVSRRYYEKLFASVNLDSRGIQKLRTALEYRAVAREFRMIADDTESIVVRFGDEEEQKEVKKLLDMLRSGTPRLRWVMRRLQPYLVSMRTRDVQRLTRDGMISAIMEGLGEWNGTYDIVRGLAVSASDHEVFVI